MPGLNIAAVRERNLEHPDPVLDLFLRQNRVARILGQCTALLEEATHEIGDMEALREMVAAKMAED